MGRALKTIIAGSRNIINYQVLLNALKEYKFPITEVVSGTASGVDKLGEFYSKVNNIPLKQFPADWNKYGKKAGYLRNVQMAEYAEALIAIWDGISKGTKMMIDIASQKGLKVYIYRYL
jgi:hypothetical protein